MNEWMPDLDSAGSVTPKEAIYIWQNLPIMKTQVLELLPLGAGWWTFIRHRYKVKPPNLKFAKKTKKSLLAWGLWPTLLHPNLPGNALIS